MHIVIRSASTGTEPAPRPEIATAGLGLLDRRWCGQISISQLLSRSFRGLAVGLLGVLKKVRVVIATKHVMHRMCSALLKKIKWNNVTGESEHHLLHIGEVN